MKSGAVGIVKRAAAVAAAALLFACTTSEPPQARVDAGALERAIRSSLARDARLAKAASVDVDARTGRVTLTGRVETPEERANAGRLACAVKGVTVVYNQIDVGRPAR